MVLTCVLFDLNHGSEEQSIGLNGIYMGKKIYQRLNHVISYPKW